jgi:hypothetical protein
MNYQQPLPTAPPIANLSYNYYVFQSQSQILINSYPKYPHQNNNFEPNITTKSTSK